MINDGKVPASDTKPKSIADILRHISARDPKPFASRLDEEKGLLDQANDLAHLMALVDGRRYFATATFHDAHTPQEQKYWMLAVAAFAMLKDVDLEQVLSDIQAETRHQIVEEIMSTPSLR